MLGLSFAWLVDCCCWLLSVLLLLLSGAADVAVALLKYRWDVVKVPHVEKGAAEAPDVPPGDEGWPKR